MNRTAWWPIFAHIYVTRPYHAPRAQNTLGLLSIRDHRWASILTDHGTSFGCEMARPVLRLFILVQSIAVDAGC
jgi:hypothetical protein